jgi:hypothetical protein
MGLSETGETFPAEKDKGLEAYRAQSEDHRASGT